jgi:hypothetical protein
MWSSGPRTAAGWNSSFVGVGRTVVHPSRQEEKLKTTSRRTISAIIAALCLVAAAFAIPASAKGGKGKGGGHGKGQGKKATIQSWDESTSTLVLTNKKGFEQTFTVADDARLTKVVPCDDDDGMDDDGMDDDGMDDDGMDDDDADDDGMDDDDADDDDADSDDSDDDDADDDDADSDDDSDDDDSDDDDSDDDSDDDDADSDDSDSDDDDADSEDKTCGNLDATTADLVAGYRVLNFKAEDGVIYKLKVKVPHLEPEPEPEHCDDPSTADVVEECLTDEETEVVEPPVEEPPAT